MADTVNVVCMKWGTLYGPHYVNRLANMVRARLARPHRFLCFTDDAEGVDPRIETAPLPPIDLAPEHAMKPWRKIGLFNERLADLEGTTLFLDLDIVIVGGLGPFFDYEPGAFCIIRNWTRPENGIGNSSVYRFEVGADSYVLERFRSEPHRRWIDEYRNSQTFLSRSVRDLRFWPAEWCVSFKKHCVPKGPRRLFETPSVPEGARIVVFHGLPNPDDALAGRWPEADWWKRPFKRLRPAPWIAEHWR